MSGGITVTGSAGADSMIGGDGNDRFVIGEGNDTVDGNLGTDTVSFAGRAIGVSITLNTGTAVTYTPTGGSAIGSIVDVENLIGTSFNDTLTGDSAANSISGGSGSDTINGGTGADTLTGGDGADRFVFTAVGESRVTSTGSVDGVDRITDFTGGTDILQLPVAAAGTLNTGSTAANLSVNATAVASTGTTIATLLTNLQTAATAQQAASAGLWAQAGDTMLVKITGASLAGTDVIYVVQNTAADNTVDDTDLIIALVGTSTQAATVATIVGP